MRFPENGRGHISQLCIFVLQKVYVAISTPFFAPPPAKPPSLFSSSSNSFSRPRFEIRQFWAKNPYFFSVQQKSKNFYQVKEKSLSNLVLSITTHTPYFPPCFILDGCCCILPLSLLCLAGRLSVGCRAKNEKKCFFLPPSHLVFPSSLARFNAKEILFLLSPWDATVELCRRSKLV